LNTDEDLKIYEFEEKPEHPKSNLASMGIYLFTWDVLKHYLIKDATQKQSSHDFGKDIIPLMLRDQLKLYAFRFNGYWKDVGTLQSYWEANMDLLKDDCELKLNNKQWRIYTNNSNFPPQFISEGATVITSLINDGCFIRGRVIESVLFRNVDVGEGSIIEQSIIHSGVKIGENCVLKKVIVMENTTIKDGTVIQVNDDGEPVVINQEVLEQKALVMGGES